MCVFASGATATAFLPVGSDGHPRPAGRLAIPTRRPDGHFAAAIRTFGGHQCGGYGRPAKADG